MASHLCKLHTLVTKKRKEVTKNKKLFCPKAWPMLPHLDFDTGSHPHAPCERGGAYLSKLSLTPQSEAAQDPSLWPKPVTCSTAPGPQSAWESVPLWQGEESRTHWEPPSPGAG